MSGLQHLVGFYTELITENLRFVLDRYDSSYGFIDTKFRIFDACEFRQFSSGRDIYSPEIVCSYIQGRGLEALAGHYLWLKQHDDSAATRKLCSRILTAIPRVIEKMQKIRERNGGRVYFMMSPEGRVLEVGFNGDVVLQETPSDAVNFSDMFYAKGLFAAARLLNDATLMDEAEEYCREVAHAVFSGTIISGRQVFSRNRQVAKAPERISHGPFMLLISMAALFSNHKSAAFWQKTAERAIGHIVDYHIDPANGNYCEFIDPAGVPLEENGIVICDPGHAMEFIGLSCKALLGFSGMSGMCNDCCKLLPKVFAKTFENGFNHSSGGFYKNIDLRSGRAVNGQMPWWSLPETIRAAVLLSRINPGISAFADQVIGHCDRAFRRYLRPETYFLAYQTRSAGGEVLDEIPAVPDADPCYHTGLSLIDALVESARSRK